MKNKTTVSVEPHPYNNRVVIASRFSPVKHQFGQITSTLRKSYFDKQHDHIIMTDGEV
jgi:Fur family ferric uptake transcriptional regulator